jgi:hypothetical protein
MTHRSSGGPRVTLVLLNVAAASQKGAAFLYLAFGQGGELSLEKIAICPGSWFGFPLVTRQMGEPGMGS